jgi:hypothetical protein
LQRPKKGGVKRVVLSKTNVRYGCDSRKQIVALEFTIGDVEDEEEREEQMQRGASLSS